MAALPSPESDARWPERLEWIAATALTAAAIVLQVINFRHAGALWRDEAAAVNLAQMPSWSAIWSNLEHESFPLLITIVVRVWTAIGIGGSDAGLRALGLTISLGILVALWWSAWSLVRRPPLLSLLLVALSPVAIRWGGSRRAYGIGVLLALVMLAAMWRLVDGLTRRRLVFASVASVLAVHALYQNALVLLALCVSAGLVAGIRRDAKLAAAVGTVGGISAVSLLPYIGVIRRASEWNEATAVSLDVERIWTVLHRALSASGGWMPWLWGAAMIAAVAAALVTIVRRQRADSARPSELSLFLVTTIVTTSAAYFAFVKVTKFPTEEWYYLLWMAITAIATEALITRSVASGNARVVHALAVLIASALILPVAAQAVRVRMTNVDEIAARLNSAVGPKDVVIVHPWFCAVSFGRYYNGAAKLLTLPPLSDVKLQRLDMVKEQMRNEQTLKPVLAEIEAALRIDGKVWLVGHFPFTNPPQPAPVMPRAGEGPEGWRAAPYMAAYGMEVAYFLQMHALQSARVEVSMEQPVHPFEDLPLRALSGWRRPRGGW